MCTVTPDGARSFTSQQSGEKCAVRRRARSKLSPGLSAVSQIFSVRVTPYLTETVPPTPQCETRGKTGLARDTVRGTVRVGRSARPPHARRAGAGAAWSSGAAGAARRVARALYGSRSMLDLCRPGSENRDRDRLYSCTK